MLRQACLYSRRRQLDEFAARLATADGALAEHAASAAARMPPIERCGDVRALRADKLPSDDPATKILQYHVAGLSTMLARRDGRAN